MVVSPCLQASDRDKVVSVPVNRNEVEKPGRGEETSYADLSLRRICVS